VFGVWCLVFGVWCLAFGVWRLAFWVQCSVSKVSGRSKSLKKTVIRRSLKYPLGARQILYRTLMTRILLIFADILAQSSVVIRVISVICVPFKAIQKNLFSTLSSNYNQARHPLSLCQPKRCKG
jgi:hypothetical protein